MVKIQSRTIRKSYGRGKNEYSYKQHLLPFPTIENKALEPFLKKGLQFRMNVKNETLNVALKKQKEKAATNQNKNA